MNWTLIAEEAKRATFFFIRDRSLKQQHCVITLKTHLFECVLLLSYSRNHRKISISMEVTVVSPNVFAAPYGRIIAAQCLSASSTGILAYVYTTTNTNTKCNSIRWRSSAPSDGMES